jgi:SAM-dependent methyltransferase
LEQKKGRETNVEGYTQEGDKTVWTIGVGDSAEAWAKSVGKVLAGKRKTDVLRLDFTQIRPAGQRLKGYGWISSGDETFAPAMQRMAERMALRPVTHERILEIGCGLGLSSLIAHRRGANVTASDCHPLTHAFLDENTRLNGLPPMTYRHGLWGTAALREDGMPVLTSAQDDGVSGLFDLIVGSDILYERDDEGTLASFINAHAALVSEIWVVDPNRGNRAAFHKHMARVGFVMHELVLDQAAHDDEAAYKGRMLTYTRG